MEEIFGLGIGEMLVICIIWGVFWGFITRKVNQNKGYYGGFWWGFFLGFLGLIIVACKGENHSSYTEYAASSAPENHSSYTGYTASSTSGNHSSYADSPLLSAAAQVDAEKQMISEKQMLSNNGWKCNRCGKVNPYYTITCVCGISKVENERLAKNAIEKTKEKIAETEAKAEKENEKELQNIQKLKAYKELLDSGAISQEEYDKKKSELLNI